jgi:chromosome partitioning protein
MEAIAIVNQKGGCAKTTTAMNLGAVLGRAGKRVLLVDLDPQATLTRSLGVRQDWNLYVSGLVGVPTGLPGMDLVPGGPDLVKHEMALTIREDFGTLRPLLSEVRGYDYVLFDCPPNLYGSTVNAIAAADRLLIPAPLEAPVLQSMIDTLRLLESIRKSGSPCPTWIAGVVTIYRKNSLEPQLVELAQKVFPALLDSRIRQSTLYTRAGLKRTAAVAIGNKSSAPVVDHLNLAREMRLLS